MRLSYEILCVKKNNNLKKNGDNFETSSPLKLLKLARIGSNNYQFTEEIEILEIRDQNLRKYVYVRPLVLSVHPRKLYPSPTYSIICDKTVQELTNKEEMKSYI